MNFFKKKRNFSNTFHSMQNLLVLQCLVDDLVDFLESSMFINVYQYIIQALI